MKKRIISLSMALLMLTSLLPTAVWAEEIGMETTSAAVLADNAAAETIPEIAEIARSMDTAADEAEEDATESSGDAAIEERDDGIVVEAAASGKCGQNVSYTLSGNGVLTISGTGAMTNFTYDDYDNSNRPWHSKRLSIRKVVIHEGVTSIGDFAFSFCNVEEVTIPSTVTSIGRRAFMGTPLPSIVIPEGVKTIGENTFWRCNSLKAITVPASTTELGNHAFDTGEYYDGSYHTQLTDIYYGGSISQWYDAGGGDAAPMVVTIHFNGATGDAIDSGKCGDSAFWKLDKTGTLTIYGSGAVYDYPTSEDDSWWMDWALPWKYYYEIISRIVVAEGITSIGAYAFYWLENATEVSLPSTLTTIGQDALCAIGVSSLVIPDNVVSIGDFAFNGCDNLKTVSLPAGLESIGICFVESTALSWIEFRGSMTQWLACGGGKSTFPAAAKILCQGGGILDLKGTCGEGLTWTLNNSGKLTISGTGEMANYDFDENGESTAPWGYVRSMIRSIEIGSGVTSIGSCAFKDTNITSLIIPDNVEIVHDYGVSGNRFLNDLALGEGLRYIGWGAFSGNKQLSAVTIPEGVIGIDGEAFFYCLGSRYDGEKWVHTGLQDVTIASSVTSIGENVFAECKALTLVSFFGSEAQWKAIGGENAGIPEGVTLQCTGTAGGGSCGNGVYWSLMADGTLVIGGKGAMMDYTTAADRPWNRDRSAIQYIVVNSGITHVGKYAFSGIANLEWAMLPYGLRSIGAYAFADCVSKGSFTIPESVTNIGDSAFRNTTFASIHYDGARQNWKNLVTVAAGNEPLANIQFAYTLGVIVSSGEEPAAPDMQALYEVLMNRRSLESWEQQMAADVNQDGEIDVYDLQRLYEDISGIKAL